MLGNISRISCNCWLILWSLDEAIQKHLENHGKEPNRLVIPTTQKDVEPDWSFNKSVLS